MKGLIKFTLSIILLFSTFLFAQSKKARLQTETKKLRSEIKNLNSKLNQNKKQASTLLEYVQDLEKMIHFLKT